MHLLGATINAKGDVSGMPSGHPRTSPPGSTGAEHMSLYPSCIRLPESSASRANATGVLEAYKTCSGCTHAWGLRSDWLAVSDCTDQLLTPIFSGGSKLNGTTVGDRWARVLCGRIGWLSEPLHRFDADCPGPTI